MKYLISAALMFTAMSAQAENFFCRELNTSNALAEGRDEYAVRITEKERMDDPTGDFETLAKVKMTVLRREPEAGNRFVLYKSFDTTARIEDVQYMINANRAEGVTMGIYLDEMDQASLSIKGVIKNVQMECEYQ